MKIGIPRALLYYWYGHIWEKFWQECGCEVVISPPTDRSIIMAGATVGLDELCLPVKIFLGHVVDLSARVDQIMIPHLIKVEKNAYICPKFMGLPDLVAHSLPNIKEKMLVVKVGPKKTDQWQCMCQTALKLGLKPTSKSPGNWAGWINSPHRSVWEKQSFFENQSVLSSSNISQTQQTLKIGLLGHPYCLYDACLNLNTLTKLNETGVNFLTPEMMPDNFKGIGSGRLTKDLFWTIGRSQFDALEWMLSEDIYIEGFIQIMPFACGPEAIVGDLLERRIRQAGKPLLKLYFEEHSGEAGMVTRLEAFLDLIRYRSKVC